MPADSPRNAVARQWEVLKCLPSHGKGITADDVLQILLAKGYRAEIRTVQRDLVALEALFPITPTPEKPFHWRWSGGSELAIAGLSLTDALGLNLLERIVKPLLPPSVSGQLDPVFKLATTKLQREKKNVLSRWSELVAVADRGIHVVAPAIQPEVLGTVHECLFNNEKVELTYTRADGTRRQGRTFSPLGLVQSGSITQLVAFSEGHTPETGVIQLAVHRISSAKRLYEEAYRPPGFSLQEFIDKGGVAFGSGGAIKLKARVSELLARQLADTKLSEDQEITAAATGSVVTATVRNTWSLKWWILEKSGHIEVLAPESLRKQVASQLRAAAAVYD